MQKKLINMKAAKILQLQFLFLNSDLFKSRVCSVFDSDSRQLLFRTLTLFLFFEISHQNAIISHLGTAHERQVTGAGIRTLDGWGWKIANPLCPDSGECSSEFDLIWSKYLTTKKSNYLFLANGKKTLWLTFWLAAFRSWRSNLSFSIQRDEHLLRELVLINYFLVK